MGLLEDPHDTCHTAAGHSWCSELTPVSRGPLRRVYLGGAYRALCVQFPCCYVVSLLGINKEPESTASVTSVLQGVQD
jgi:hypothetical protein